MMWQLRADHGQKHELGGVIAMDLVIALTDSV
jgi:hypothetical protein